MTIENDKYYQMFITEKNISEKTIKSYRIALTHYSKFHEKTITNLIEEADNEEEEKIRMKHRKIKQRLIRFRKWLINQNFSKNYIKGTFRQIKTFYEYFEIEIPKLQPTNIKEKYHERYEDIPKKEHIKQALESTNNIMYKALILFMSSSGSARTETHNLTVEQFIEATRGYHDEMTVEKILKQLEQQDDVVPLFQMVRQKTDYPYYTCCSPEATNMIVRHLLKQKNFKLTNKIFNIKRDSISVAFNRMNKHNGWDKKPNNINFFHSHGLRKFHSTAIEDIGFANTLQGRRADIITETYFKHNPERIREKYLEHLPKLTINKTIINSVDSEVTKELREELKAEREARLIAENKANNAQIMAEEANRKVDDFIKGFEE